MKLFPEFHSTEFTTPEERLAASLKSPLERQAMITNLLVPYPQFQRVKNNVARFHRPVDGGSHGVGWIGGVLGSSRTGKSFILQSYAAENPPIPTEFGYDFPVVYLEARAEWDALEFGRQIYHGTGASAIPRMSTAALNTMSANRVKQFNVQLVVIDDAQFLFSTPGRKQTAFISLIKHLADQRTCNILLVGTPSIEQAVQNDPHLLNRGGFPRFRVREFDRNTPDDRGRFRFFLTEVEKRLPFAEPSNLARKEYVEDFLNVSEGSIGKAMNIIIAAGHMAINEGRNCISAQHLRKAAEVRLIEGVIYVPFAALEAAE
ncbi:TniB family NTP-binding protein [Rhizobium sp. 9T]|uniref:TniB family NTP-binding protein n=1 Tax=Rhizobium croatiense TaxID=2867516 RepID=UPI001C9332B3|nr:TniB family NTP-binding protein [Rhizobium croatiense]MBY4607472.1 TniB family NTP-binding protein [Rhizobium croatiense]